MSLADSLFGRRLATHEEEEQHVGVLAGIAMLGLDALSSSAYGPEAALTLLIPLGTLGIAYIGPISLLIIALLFIVYLSYRHRRDRCAGTFSQYRLCRFSTLMSHRCPR